MTAQNKSIVLLFTLTNILIAIFTYSIGLRPMMAEWSGLRALLRIQESRYTIKEQNWENHEANLQTLAGLGRNESGLHVVPYTDLIDTFSQIGTLANRLGLQERDFYTNEPVSHEMFYHVRAFAFYTGCYHDICLFLEYLSAMPVHIDQVSIVPDHTEAVLWVHLSLYATGTGE
jgi:Tfp pilus assembly protein PilO